MRPVIRKTPHIARKAPNFNPGEIEKLVLNDEAESIPSIPKGPKFSLSRNKRKQQPEDRAKNAYAALNEIKRAEDQGFKLKLQQLPSTVTEVASIRPNFKHLKRNLKENNLDLQKQEQSTTVNEIKKDPSFERVPDVPSIDLYENHSQSIGLNAKSTTVRPKRIIKKQQDEPLAQQNDFASLKEEEKLQEPEEFSQYTKVGIPPPVPRPDYKINLAELQIREINLAEQVKPENLQKQEKQLERVKNLSRIISLEKDLYQQTLSLRSVTEYELYISKIKSGTLNNAIGQAFDDTADKSCQNAPLESFEFGNQAPEDRKTTYIRGLDTSYNSSLTLYTFVLKAAVVIQEMLRPAKSFTMPPIYLLSLNPVLVGLYLCPVPISLYKCNDLSLALVGQKLYVARGHVTALLSLGSLILGGTEQGTVLLWSGQSEKGRLYQIVKGVLGNSQFQLPTCSSDYLERESYFKGSSQIVNIKEKSGNQFYSLEEFGKLITWGINTKQTSEGTTRYQLQPLTYISLSALYNDSNIVCSGLFKDPSQQIEGQKGRDSLRFRYYVTCSNGIVKTAWQSGSPNYFQTQSQVVDMVVTIRGNLIYTICTDNCLRIFSKSLSQPLVSILVPSQHQLQSVFIPCIVLQEGKELELLAQVFISDTRGRIYHYNLIQNPTYPKHVISHEGTSQKSLLKTTVTLNQGKAEMMFVTRELRTVYKSETLDIDMSRNTQNYKRIIEEDKRVIQFLYCVN